MSTRYRLGDVVLVRMEITEIGDEYVIATFPSRPGNHYPVNPKDIHSVLPRPLKVGDEVCGPKLLAAGWKIVYQTDRCSVVDNGELKPLVVLTEELSRCEESSTSTKEQESS